MNAANRPRRPTAEEWYHATSVIPDVPPPPPRPQPTPPKKREHEQQPPKQNGPKITRLAYWLSVIGMWVIFAVTVKTQNDAGVLFITSVILALAYITVAAMRSNDMGKTPWFSFIALVPVSGLWPFLWLGIAESHAPGKMKPDKEDSELIQILIGTGICAILVGSAIVVLMTMLNGD